jgi:hypothetical protein
MRTKIRAIASAVAYGNPHKQIARTAAATRPLARGLCTVFESGGKGELKRDKMMYCRMLVISHNL